jgi:hypothetical protein
MAFLSLEVKGDAPDCDDTTAFNESGILHWNDYRARSGRAVRDAIEEAARIAESAELTDRHWPEVSP